MGKPTQAFLDSIFGKLPKQVLDENMSPDQVGTHCNSGSEIKHGIRKNVPDVTITQHMLLDKSLNK